MYKLAILVPYFNHPDKIVALCDRLKSFEVDILIVDDGSNEISKKAIHEIDGVMILTRQENGGKGAAMKDGFAHLLRLGYTHALQIDADFQHNVDDIEKLIECSMQFKSAFVCTQPTYNESAPKARLYGRKITNFWIYINTFGGIRNDGMCGFRIYPLLELEEVFKETKTNRMEFDTEILVNAFWNGVDFFWIETPVRYEVGGVSHFKAFRDNVLISKMHARMFFKLFPRLLSVK